ncbi:hypothetical protein [Bartonella harrusi]|uniref:Uncharacterized protein n=1 Tax=Bartonella harrusi TaxID=2961895 RepID=A0ABY5ESH0_9HYPH|nr:hypothetical protein [Bartonella harrusi]UTO28074.1 hypothetical protein NMK50_07665 [Bartonella harrusi]
MMEKILVAASVHAFPTSASLVNTLKQNQRRSRSAIHSLKANQRAFEEDDLERKRTKEDVNDDTDNQKEEGYQRKRFLNKSKKTTSMQTIRTHHQIPYKKITKTKSNNCYSHHTDLKTEN